MANRWGNNGNSERLWGAPKLLQMVTAAMKLKDAYSLEETHFDLSPSLIFTGVMAEETKKETMLSAFNSRLPKSHGI